MSPMTDQDVIEAACEIADRLVGDSGEHIDVETDTSPIDDGDGDYWVKCWIRVTDPNYEED